MNTHRHKQKEEHGIGLYTYEQVRNTTPFGYAAQVVVGAIFFSLGVMLLINRTWFLGFIFVLIGAFFAHAGLIFWWKKLAIMGNKDTDT